jgi:glycosyltransferase involved in cell wall biosynthesis
MTHPGDRSTILLVAGDPLGDRMAGPAIRVVELARALAAAGSEVAVAAPAVGDLVVPGVRLVAAPGHNDLRALAAGARAIIVFSAVAAEHRWLFDLDVPVAVDAYDPGLLETLERFRGAPLNEQRDWVRDAGRHLTEPLGTADLVLVASERQRHYVLGLLTAQGRVNPRTWVEDPTLRTLCEVVPFGVADGAPAADPDGPLRRGGRLVGDGAVVALWGGGLYDWLDPLLLVEAVARSADPRLTAVFLAGPHPTPAVGRAPLVERVRERAGTLGLLGSRVVLVEEWVPYAERGSWLTGSDIGVSLHRDHLETTFAFRTRVLDYLWAGLPVVSTEGDHFAEVVERHDLGAVVPFGDADAVARALDRIAAEGPDELAARRRRSAEVAERHRWPRVVEPLARWCRDPRLAADRRG